MIYKKDFHKIVVTCKILQLHNESQSAAAIISTR